MFPDYNSSFLDQIKSLQQISICYTHSISLYARGRVLSHQRGKRITHPKTSLIQIEGSQKIEDAKFYLGKRIAYVYKGKKAVNGSKVRVIWGKCTRTHGNSGAVRAKFASNLPPRTFGASCRIVS
ncbi:hypothetical protein E3Q12_00325 [Wallemia mellicola]|nr:hypothetical protein E3Q12_00325 [Wallemia mellicola]